MSGVEISGCTAETFGGAIYYTTNAIVQGTLTNVAISNCDAATGDGGGVYVEAGHFTVRGGSIEGCTAQNGGAVYTSADTFAVTTDSGGNGTRIANCTATSASTVKGGAIYVTSGTATLFGASIAECATTYTGTASSDSYSRGGAVYNDGGTIEINDTTISACTTFSSRSNGYGGAIYNTNGSLELNNCILIGAGTSTSPDANSGGAVYNSRGGTVSITGGSFSGFYVSGDGGAIGSSGSAVSLEIDGATISGCTADAGGGIYATVGTVTITGVEISGCTAGSGGGGGIFIFSNDVSLTMTGGSISGCTATAGGSGIFADWSSTFTWNSGSIAGNTGTGGDSCQLHIDGSTLDASGNSGVTFTESSAVADLCLGSYTFLGSVFSSVLKKPDGTTDDSGGGTRYYSYN